MKKRELVEIIRVAVRKELKEFLPTLVRECTNVLSDGLDTTETDPVELTKRVLKKESQKPTRSKNKVRYTQNEVLNNILNETTGGVPSEGSRVSGAPEEPQTDFNGESIDVGTLPDRLSSALTRDYSEVMAAIDKKKGMS